MSRRRNIKYKKLPVAEERFAESITALKTAYTNNRNSKKNVKNAVEKSFDEMKSVMFDVLDLDDDDQGNSGSLTSSITSLKTDNIPGSETFETIVLDSTESYPVVNVCKEEEEVAGLDVDDGPGEEAEGGDEEDPIPGFFERIWTRLKDFFKWLWSKIKAAAVAVKNAVVNAFNAICAWLKSFSADYSKYH